MLMEKRAQISLTDHASHVLHTLMFESLINSIFKPHSALCVIELFLFLFVTLLGTGEPFLLHSCGVAGQLRLLPGMWLPSYISCIQGVMHEHKLYLWNHA